MTAYHARVEGHWLSLEPIAPIRVAPFAARPRWVRLGVAVVVVVALAAAAGLGLRTLVGTSVDSSASSPREATSEPAPSATSAVLTSSLQTPIAPAELASSFARWSQEFGVPVALLEALTWHESRWQPHAVSEAGAIGLAQLMPPTAAAIERSLGLDLDPRVPDDAIRMSAHLMATLLASAAGDVPTALAGYTQSAWSVRAHGMTATTREYVNSVMALYEQFRAHRP